MLILSPSVLWASEIVPVSPASQLSTNVGGLSDLSYEESTGTFWATTDNRTGSSVSPMIFQFRLNNGAFELLRSLPLRDELGNLVPASPSSVPAVTDPGLDPEGIDVAPDGTLWMVEEERQTLFHVSRSGQILSRHFAPGFSDLTRKRGGGFEGVAVSADGATVYVGQQTPLASDAASDPTYLLAFTPATESWRVYRYAFESIPAQGYPTTGLGPAVKMGVHGLEALTLDENGNEQLLVLERDNKSAENARNKRVFRVTLPAESSAVPLEKNLVADLVAAGYRWEKPEGVVLNGPTLYILNDNSQGGNNAADVPEPTELWILDPLPPRIRYVGAVDAPVTTPATAGSCSVNVDNVNQIAGGCSATDLATCTFGNASTLALDVGTHDVRVSSTTTSGASAFGTSYVEVTDGEAPSFNLFAWPPLLLPANGKMHSIFLSAPSDNCGATVDCSVSSNEAIDGDVMWEAGKLKLRAETDRRGLGRVYRISCTASDAAGNQTTRTTNVLVPRWSWF